MALDELDILEQAANTDADTPSSLDFMKFLRGIWNRKYIILGLIVLFAVPFYLISKNKAPVYESQVVIQVKDFGDESEKALNSMRIAEIQSRSFRERVVGSLGTAISLTRGQYKDIDDVFSVHRTDRELISGMYKINVDNVGMFHVYQILSSGADDKPKNVETLHLMSGDAWDAVENEQFVNGFHFTLNPDFASTPGEVEFRLSPFDKAVRRLEASVTVTPSKTGKTLFIRKTGGNPESLPKELNRIAEQYVKETVALQSSDDSNYRSILLKQLKVAEAKLDSSEKRLRQFTARFPLSLDAEKETLLGRVKENDRALRELPQQKQRLSELIRKLDEPQAPEFEYQYRQLVVRSIANFQPMANDPQMVILSGTLTTLEDRYRGMSEFSDNNPDVVTTRNKIAETQQKIINYAKKYLNSMVAQEAELRKIEKSLQSKIHSLPNDEYRLLELERQKRIDESQYTMLLEKVQRLEIAEANDQEFMRILDRAYEPRRPINATTTFQSMMGALIGLALGLVISIVIDATDKRIRSVREVNKFVNLPIIGTIPYVTFADIPDYMDSEKAKQIDRQLVTHDYSPTPIGEAYRALRTHLLFSKELDNVNSLLITSVSQEDGKSFSASNLAIIMAQQKTNTLLVDADLRRGVLHNTFGVQKEPGLTNYLANNATLSELVQKTHIPNLSVISCGSMIPNPSEQLGSLQMKRFLSEASRKFDFIIFDAPPVEAATDAVVLGTIVDAVSIVVRAGKTKKKSAKERLEIFKSVPVKLAGVIFNGTEEALLKSSYSYYHY